VHAMRHASGSLPSGGVSRLDAARAGSTLEK
jgi:hypothetical protein